MVRSCARQNHFFHRGTCLCLFFGLSKIGTNCMIWPTSFTTPGYLWRGLGNQQNFFECGMLIRCGRRNSERRLVTPLLKLKSIRLSVRVWSRLLRPVSRTVSMVFFIAWTLTRRHSPSEPIFLENGLVRKLNGQQICSRKPFIECSCHENISGK